MADDAPTEKQPRLGFSQAAAVDRSYRRLPERITSPFIRAVAETFVKNVDAVFAQVETAALCAGLVWHGRGNWKSIPMFGNRPGKQLTPEQLGTSPLAEDVRAQAIADGWTFVDDWAERDLGVRAGLEDTLATQLNNAWTAFEVLAKDLWIATFNTNPHVYGPRALRAETYRDENLEASLSAPPPPDDFPPSKSKPVITFFNQLLEYDAIIVAKAGEMLADQGKFNFNRFKGISHAFRVLFSLKASSGFMSGEPFASVELLELLRNLRLHRAGVVDRFFLTRVGETKISWFVPPSLNDTFKPGGVLAKSMSESVIAAGAELLAYCDSFKPE